MREFIIAANYMQAQQYMTAQNKRYEYIVTADSLRGLRVGRLVVLPGAKTQRHYNEILINAEIAGFVIELTQEKKNGE